LFSKAANPECEGLLVKKLHTVQAGTKQAVWVVLILKANNVDNATRKPDAREVELDVQCRNLCFETGDTEGVSHNIYYETYSTTSVFAPDRLSLNFTIP
jgi:hypothetical protein